MQSTAFAKSNSHYGHTSPVGPCALHDHEDVLDSVSILVRRARSVHLSRRAPLPLSMRLYASEQPPLALDLEQSRGVEEIFGSPEAISIWIR